MDWSHVRGDFERDGALRDIYVLDAELADWEGFWSTCCKPASC
jgi:hypothetical protein